jgi:hypothetical protein
MAGGEYLAPIAHTNLRQLRTLAGALDGSGFYVKALDWEPRVIPGGYMVMTKLKRIES